MKNLLTENKLIYQQNHKYAALHSTQFDSHHRHRSGSEASLLDLQGQRGSSYPPLERV